MVDIQIGECPKCGKRTFVVYEHKKMMGINFKGQCYNCGVVKEFDY